MSAERDGPIAAAVALLCAEAPPQARLLADALRGAPILVRWGDEEVTLGCDGDRPRVGPARALPVRLGVTREVALDLLEGRVSWITALRDERVTLYTPISRAARLDLALRSAISGLVRCPSAPALLSRLRAGWYAGPHHGGIDV